MKYQVWKIREGRELLEELEFEGDNKAKAIKTGKDIWHYMENSDKKSNKVEVREVIDDYEKESGEIIYNYNLIWKSNRGV